MEHDQKVRKILAQCDEPAIRELAALAKEIQRDYPRRVILRSKMDSERLLRKVEAVRAGLGNKDRREE